MGIIYSEIKELLGKPLKGVAGKVGFEASGSGQHQPKIEVSGLHQPARFRKGRHPGGHPRP